MTTVWLLLCVGCFWLGCRLGAWYAADDEDEFVPWCDEEDCALRDALSDAVRRGDCAEAKRLTAEAVRVAKR
jgi:hypothetical protein